MVQDTKGQELLLLTASVHTFRTGWFLISKMCLFAVSFGESLNNVTQKGQMDVITQIL